jgi:hypothetical protein
MGPQNPRKHNYQPAVFRKEPDHRTDPMKIARRNPPGIVNKKDINSIDIDLGEPREEV